LSGGITVTTKRLFVAIDLPDTIKRLLVTLDPDVPGVRWTSAEQLHLTLGFFGEVSEEPEAKLRDHLRAIKFRSFVLPVQGLGAFPSPGSPKILWIGVSTGHPHLFQIHRRVQEAALRAGLEPDLRPWHPHITLARCRTVPSEAVRTFLSGGVDLDAGMFRVEEFSLYSSKLTPAGSIYMRELTIPCSGGL
jgi:2'-5' RNA ligase